MSTLTPEQQSLADEMAAEGLGVRTIARLLALPRGPVRWYLDRKQRPATVTTRAAGAFRAVVYDLETTNLRSDLGMLAAAAFFDIGTGEMEWRNIDSFKGTPAERERQLAGWAAANYAAADMLIGHNILAFDKHFLDGVLRRHHLPRLPKRIIADTYLIARYGFKGLVHSYSLANMADYFRCEGVKDKPSIHDWRELSMDMPESVERITQRCLRDVQLNAEVWPHLKHDFFEWRGQ